MLIRSLRFSASVERRNRFCGKEAEGVTCPLTAPDDVLGHRGPEVFLWDTETGRVRLHIKLARNPVVLRFAPSGRFMISSTEWEPRGGDCWNRTEQGGLPETALWNIKTSRLLKKFPGQVFAALSDDEQSMLTFSVRVMPIQRWM